METQDDLKAQLKDWKIMPPTNPNACILCGEIHDPKLPHNKDSLTYQYTFAKEYGRWPKWSDAAKHCSPEVKQTLIQTLEKHNVVYE